MKTATKRIAIFLFWVGAWEVASVCLGSELILPSPAAVVMSLLRLCTQGDFYASVFCSLCRVLSGFAGAVAGGILFALTAKFCPVVRDAVSPVMKGIRMTPVVSFILLLYFSVPRGRIPIVTVFLMALPIVYAFILRGLDETAADLLELARLYDLPTGKQIIKIYLPSCRPYLCEGLLTALGLGFKAGIAAEVLCLPQWAIGTFLQTAKSLLNSPDLFAVTAVLLLLGFLSEKVLSLLFRSFRRLYLSSGLSGGASVEKMS